MDENNQESINNAATIFHEDEDLLIWGPTNKKRETLSFSLMQMIFSNKKYLLYLIKIEEKKYIEKSTI
ncbi:hypothetical protein ACSBO6_05430 [Bacillus sp. AL-1R]